MFPEERRLATVLFADIQGFTALAEQLDFEEVSDLIKEIWAVLDGVIESHGGYIDKHLGDGVMAVWGAPQAREDDAERAVTAGLALQSAFSEYTAHSSHPGAAALKLRVGINTGLVLASYIGVRREYTVIGDTVNVANRLEQVAEPGTVAIGASTYQLVRGGFQVRRMSPLQVKGRTEPLSPWSVEGRLEQPTRMRYHSMGGLETHMVGREAELSQLKEYYRQARAAAVPVFVLVQSEAGLGKSRLMMEFSSQMEADEPGLAMLSTRGLAQTSRAPFYLWKSLWYNRFGLYDNELPGALREKFLRGIQSLWGTGRSPVAAVEAAHWIGSLSGLEWPNSPYLAGFQDQPEARLRRAFEMTREILRRVCVAGPTILVFDDLQWADESSLSLLAHLLRPASEPIPLLILAAARPELLRRYPALARVIKVITLQPLPTSPEVVAEAYPALHTLPKGLLSELAQRAEGNPYYLEEMVKSLLQARPTLIEPNEVWRTNQLLEILPESLQAVLQARLDSLSQEARNTALLASVVGRVFWVGAVVAASRQTAGTGLLRQLGDGPERTIAQGLAELARAEMAFPRAGSVFVGEQEYIFKHSILREVAYGLIPHKYVRQYHLAVARWLSGRAGPDFAARVAEHLEQAGVYEEAAQQYEHAARFVQSRGAVKEAEWMLGRAKELRGKLPLTAPLVS